MSQTLFLQPNLSPQHLTVGNFAAQLIDTKDLDPVYVGLTNLQLPFPQLSRWLFAYWCFYDVGVASYLSEFQDRDYWKGMLVAAGNVAPPPNGGRWPRGAERRHFRGQKCVDAINHFSRRPVMAWFCDLEASVTAAQVIDIARGWPQFGPWIGFKIADMLEVVWGHTVIFDEKTTLYAQPAACLDLLLADMEGALPPPSKAWVFDQLIKSVSIFREPASGHRACSMQEAETVLCKYKSYRNGRYWVGKDIKETRHNLHGWGQTAERMLSVMPEEVR
jgi:hypothetical protein